MTIKTSTLAAVTSALLLGFASQSALALSCNSVLGQDPEYLSKDSGEGPAWSAADIKKLKKERAECQQMAKNARVRLKDEFKVKNAASLTDREALSRIDEEIYNRKAAQQRADDKRREEERQRQSKVGQDQMKMGKEMMDQQTKMLQGLGVKLGDPADGKDENDDSDIDAAELQMYQKMVDSGAAPGCKGKKGQALLDCVDEAMGD